MGTFDLEPALPPGAKDQSSGQQGMGVAVLLQNARWFTQIRWVAVAVLVLFGVAAKGLPGVLEAAGVVRPALWPWLLAGVVALVNLVNIGWLRRMTARASRSQAEAHIWFQIVVDLFLLTTLVYFVGPVDTVVPFAYLFHIALACIFFGRRKSLIVTFLSAILFLSLVASEAAGWLRPRTILDLGLPCLPDAFSFLTTTLPTVFIWFVVWYLVSTISGAVRQRDRELDAANQRLRKADEEKNLQVLRVTHDLKAPFVGIESNIQILKAAHWDALPQAVREIIAKIEARGATLRARIGDILTLGDLRTTSGEVPVAENVELYPLLSSVIQEVQGLASQRKVTVDLGAVGAAVSSEPRQLKILFLNLIANAVAYSHESGNVEVLISGRERPVRVRVVDHGIGISDKALPHIFEDYYRAKNAAQFNPQSTGLGLAIVRQIALNLGLTVRVESVEGEGTTFEVVFPVEGESGEGRVARGANQDR